VSARITAVSALIALIGLVQAAELAIRGSTEPGRVTPSQVSDVDVGTGPHVVPDFHRLVRHHVAAAA
jgi:hypothetical protein